MTMARRSKNGLVLFGVGVLALMTLRKERDGIAWGHGWHWPVPDFFASDGARYAAVISQEIKPGKHGGVDVMFRRRSVGDRADFPAGIVDGGGAKQGKWFFAPREVPILAARDARVWSVGKGPRGISVVLDHGRPWATYYQHLASTPLVAHAKGVKQGGGVTLVKAGEQIGTMGHDPLDGELLRHLHFEAWYQGGDSRASQDPAGELAQWGRSTWRT